MDNQQSRHILLYLLFVFQVCLFNSFLSEIFSVRCGGCVGINKHFSRPDFEDGKTELQSATELILGSPSSAAAGRGLHKGGLFLVYAWWAGALPSILACPTQHWNPGIRLWIIKCLCWDQRVNLASRVAQIISWDLSALMQHPYVRMSPPGGHPACSSGPCTWRAEYL